MLWVGSKGVDVWCILNNAGMTNRFVTRENIIDCKKAINWPNIKIFAIITNNVNQELVRSFLLELKIHCSTCHSSITVEDGDTIKNAHYEVITPTLVR